ncbi:MAG TPA: hypothetical protein VJ385_17840 [Fibrobacteria bacterium]|nr:hypothetical protein [Fibrobacteria bacterium]
MLRKDRAALFRLGGGAADGPEARQGASGNPSAAERAEAAEYLALRQSLLAAALAIYPLIYIMALLHNIGELDNFSIRLPSDVYSDGLLWMLYATPLVGLAGLLAWKASLRPGLRALIFFYGSVLAVLGWIMVWERLDLFLAAQLQGTDRDALLFPFRAEQIWRSGVKALFYGGSFLLGIGYLVGSRRTNIFARRAMFLGLPSLLMYANMLFMLGDWNFYLAGMRERAFRGHDYGLYRFAARAQLARTPAAYATPSLLEEWAELEYQSGDVAKAGELLRALSRKCRSKPYYAKPGKRADSALAHMDRKGAREAALQLDLPIIKPASYLDREWYALLSAVAFLKPGWTDLELKKRLLDLSNTVQLHLPRLDNVPELIPALRQLQLPVTTCFLTADRIKTALAAGRVPFLSVYGHWVPISGYDPGRDGFYYYAYDAPGGFDWFRNEDTDLFYHHEGEAFGGETEKRKTRAYRYSLQKFISRAELEDHILDIGGVGMVLGDSVFAGASERKAAFLVEQGDVYYQDHENYREAALAYRQAGALHPCDQVFSRMVYLKRRYWEFATDARDYQNLFHDYPPGWMVRLGPEKAVERDIVAKIMAGRLGSYLMLNWYVAPMPDTSAESKAAMDTALALFRELHRMDPDEPLYTDSLATLLARRGDLQASESLYAELAGLYPSGSESVFYRLAWIKLKLGRMDELPDLLARCRAYDEDAKYLTMKGAVSMRKGRFRGAYAALSRSLKLDKSIGETHALLADYYRHRGDRPSMQVHLNWQRRST